MEAEIIVVQVIRVQPIMVEDIMEEVMAEAITVEVTEEAMVVEMVKKADPSVQTLSIGTYVPTLPSLLSPSFLTSACEYR